MRRALASADSTSGDTREEGSRQTMPERREQRQRLRRDTDADGSAGGRGDGNCKAVERATERGGEAATKGRKAVYILLTPLREWRVGTPRLPSPDCDSVEDEPVLLQMQ